MTAIEDARDYAASLVDGDEILDGLDGPVIEPFRLSRFYENEIVSERGAAAVSH